MRKNRGVNYAWRYVSWSDGPVATQDEARRESVECYDLRCGVRQIKMSIEGNTQYSFVADNVAAVREKIARAAIKAGRKAEEITLIAVSKTHPAEAIRAAYECGVRDFGENRVQEWEGKRAAAGGLNQMRMHLIGHLQSNKAARAANLFSSVDSVDDFAIAQRLNGARGESSSGSKLRILLEVHIAGEDSKSGAAPEEIFALAGRIVPLPNLELVGLMCIPPYLEDIEGVRPYFRRLRGLRDETAERLGVKLPVLSMGMSHDFAVAIEEGSTEVRVGTAIFGNRESVK